MKTIHVLFAIRQRSVAESLRREMDDAERCTFNIVTSGSAAIASARQCPPDILVVDAVLEGVDGLGVIDCLREMLGDRMPRVIGGTMLPMGEKGFHRRGVSAVLRVPWQREELRGALLQQMEEIETRIDWDRAQHGYDRACALLRKLGMRSTLKGFDYLTWAAGLAYDNEARLFAVGRDLYAPIAQRFGATEAAVERLIRHAVESTMDSVGADGIYGFFGNTIDPTRGKPTNAQMIAMLVQRMRVM